MFKSFITFMTVIIILSASLLPSIAQEWSTEKAKAQLFTSKIKPPVFSKYRANDKNSYKDYVDAGSCLYDNLGEGNYRVHCFDKDLFDVKLTYDKKRKLIAVSRVIFPESMFSAINSACYGEMLKDLFNQNKTFFYPYKVYNYLYPEGKLLGLEFHVSSEEFFDFKPDGILNSHCVDNQCFDAEGKVLQGETVY